MGFNLWLVIFLALMPVFILFTGLSAAGGFQSSADWQVICTVLAAAIITGYLAKRRGDEISNETSIEARLMKDAEIPVDESDPGTKFVSSLPPWFVHELDPSDLAYSNREEVVAPTFHLGFDDQKHNVSGRAIAVRPTSALANSRSVTGTTRGSPRQGQTANAAEK